MANEKEVIDVEQIDRKEATPERAQQQTQTTDEQAEAKTTHQTESTEQTEMKTTQQKEPVEPSVTKTTTNEDEGADELTESDKKFLESSYEEFVRDKTVIINHFKGAINAPFSSGGDVNVGNNSNNVSSLHLSKHDISRLKDVFVPHSTFQDGIKQLEKNRLLILFHSDNVGKYTAGVVSLSKLVGNNVHQLYPSISMKELTEKVYRKNAGYIIDTVDKNFLNDFDEYSLKLIKKRLAESESYLIITANSDNFKHSNIKDYLFKCERPTEISLIIEKHLYSGDLSPLQIKKTKELLKREDFQHFVDINQLNPREIEDICSKLSRVITDEASFESVFQSLEQNLDKKIHDWFAAHDDVNLRTFMIALAVFNGLEYNFISSAAKGLRIYLDYNSIVDRPFQFTKVHLLEELGAVEFEAQINTHFGTSAIRCVRFRNEEDAKAVLRYVWANYPDEHDSILSWIKEFSKIEEFTMSEILAESLANLCHGEPDFFKIQSEIIQEWAKDDNPFYRFSAVLILMELALYKEYISPISKLVHSWACSRNKCLNWTAAVAYGTNIGINMLPQTVIDLRGLYFSRNSSIRKVCFDSFSSLFKYSCLESETLELIVAFYLWWIDNSENDKELARALTTFISIFQESDATTLLHLYKEKEIIKDGVIPISLMALKKSQTRQHMLVTIEQMFQLIGEEEKASEFIEYFLLCLMLEGDNNVENYIFNSLNKVMESPYQKQAIPIIKNLLY